LHFFDKRAASLQVTHLTVATTGQGCQILFNFLLAIWQPFHPKYGAVSYALQNELIQNFGNQKQYSRYFKFNLINIFMPFVGLIETKREREKHCVKIFGQYRTKTKTVWLTKPEFIEAFVKLFYQLNIMTRYNIYFYFCSKLM